MLLNASGAMMVRTVCLRRSAVTHGVLCFDRRRAVLRQCPQSPCCAARPPPPSHALPLSAMRRRVILLFRPAAVSWLRAGRPLPALLPGCRRPLPPSREQSLGLLASLLRRNFLLGYSSFLVAARRPSAGGVCLLLC